MRSITISLAAALLLAACTASDQPSEPAEATPPEQPSGNLTTAAPKFTYFGRLSYDGIHAVLAGCDGQIYWLEDSLWVGVIEEVKRLKADPSYAIWIQVETIRPTVDRNGGPIILREGTLGSTHKDPCPAASPRSR